MLREIRKKKEIYRMTLHVDYKLRYDNQKQQNLRTDLQNGADCGSEAWMGENSTYGAFDLLGVMNMLVRGGFVMLHA